MNIIAQKTNSGFLLVEAIISITILIMVAATSISLLVMGHRAINVNEHSLEASWLAQEAAESLRGLRDTNWIRYGYNKEGCWTSTSNVKCDPGGINNLSGSEASPNQFILATSLTDPPTLVQAKDPLELAEGPEANMNLPFLLYYQDLDNTVDYDGDGITDNDKEYIGPDTAGYTIVEPSKYYRQVETWQVAPGHFEAIVTTGWYEGSTPHEIKLPVTLTNYQLEE